MFPRSGAVVMPRTPRMLYDDDQQVLAAISAFKPRKKGSLLSRVFGDKTETEMIRDYDQSGPGIVGFYLDLKADMSALVDMRIQQWNPETMAWEWSNHPTANSVLRNDLVGPNGERLPEFVRAFARELECVGQIGFAAIDTASGVRYRTFSLDSGSYEVVTKVKGVPSVLGFKGSPGTKRPKNAEEAANSPDWIEVEVDAIHQIYRPHPRWFAEPYSPLSRALKDVRRFDNAARALHRATASQLVNGGLMWFKGGMKDLKYVEASRREDNNGHDSGSGPKLGFLGGQIQSLMQAGERSLQDYDERETLSAMFHPVVTEEVPPQFIDAGRSVDPNLITVKRDALEDFARSVNIPMSVLVEGQGAAQRMLNEWLQDKAFKQTAIMPDARRVAAGLTAAFLHPRMGAIATQEPRLFLSLDSSRTVPVSDFRIWPDEASLTNDEPNISDVREAVKLGVLDPEALVDAMEASEYRLDRPDGVSSYDWWQALNGLDAETPDEAASDVTSSLGYWEQKW